MLDQALKSARDGVADTITAALKDVDLRVADAMRYAVIGGKGLRGFLVIESARLHRVSGAMPVAAAIECLHSYSLIHDDLPCMDDDDLRRGQPTVHIKWDEATAVLAGDALQSLAFDLIFRADLSAEARAELMGSLAIASGVRGMVGGQALDIAAESADRPLTLDEITTLQAGKTGALITWSAMAGPRMAGAETAPLKTYGDALGLAFQIADDILDVEGDAATVGKAVGKDAGAGKATFVSLLGLAEAKRRAADLVEQACDALQVYGHDADTLCEAARFVITRNK
ncbi:MAG: polyprenyl synthetase family protein [Pseudomonadota bacterium]